MSVFLFELLGAKSVQTHRLELMSIRVSSFYCVFTGFSARPHESGTLSHIKLLAFGAWLNQGGPNRSDNEKLRKKQLLGWSRWITRLWLEVDVALVYTV